MINRISEIPFWGPEEQIRRFINQHDDSISEGTTQQTITQQRIENLDDIFQKQLIWSYGRPKIDDAYFYQDWCPKGVAGNIENPKWQMELWGETMENKARSVDRSFNWREFSGYTNSRSNNEMVAEYGSSDDMHTEDKNQIQDPTDLDINTLRHNIMRSYIEVSEWLGDGATMYGSHNGYVSRKMSLAWLFNAIKALINWKLANNDKWAEVDIHPLVKDEEYGIFECFRESGGLSTQGHDYKDEEDLDQIGGRCQSQRKERAKEPWKNGVLKVRGNEFHYGERADFYTHTSFIGECRFFHNARFLGQTTFDKEINGTAMRSRWADLAEYKESDEEYLPGTLVMFGGEKEITLSRNGVANAVVTTKPGFILNGDESSKNCIMVGVALTGTVPVRVIGEVRKFDRLVPSKRFPGLARRRRFYDIFRKTIGIAMQDGKDGGTVECVTRMAL